MDVLGWVFVALLGLVLAAAVVMGAPGRTLILVGSALSMLGYTSGMTLAVPRMLFAFGRDGFLPRQFAAVHPRFHTPHVAIIVQSILVIIVAVSGSFETRWRESRSCEMAVFSIPQNSPACCCLSPGCGAVACDKTAATRALTSTLSKTP